MKLLDLLEFKADKKIEAEPYFTATINNKTYQINNIARNLTTKDLDLSYSYISKFPENLTVNGNLNLKYTALKSLPNNLKVSGKIFVNTNLHIVQHLKSHIIKC